MYILHDLIHIRCIFAYVFAMSAASPSPIMDSTTVGRRPKAASIMGDGEAANTATTYPIMYQIFANLHILPISLKSPYVYPGAIRLARSGAPVGPGQHRILAMLPGHQAMKTAELQISLNE